MAARHAGAAAGPARMLFFRLGSFSNINQAVLDGMRASLPHTAIVDVDLYPMIRNSRTTMLANSAAALMTYGGDIARRRRSLTDSFFTTRYLFGHVRRLALQLHRQHGADCSFQTQSLFDCSTPGVPHFVYTDHTFASNTDYADYGQRRWAPVRPAWLIELESQIYRNAASVFAMSSNVLTTLTDRYGVAPQDALCVGAGSNVDQSQLLDIATTADRYRSQHVLFVGVDWERKGGPLLLEAFRRARLVHPRARLTIAGCHPPIAETGVEVIGRVAMSELVQRYAAASIFCLPTRLEMFGIVFLEAMAAALPVIAPRQGAVPDFVHHEHNGLLTSPGDVDELTTALVDLLGSPERCRRFGEDGRDRFQSGYSWERSCAAMARRIAERVQ